MDYAWIVFLLFLVALYGPLAKKLYLRWKNFQQKKKQPNPLLGVVYPQETNNSKDN